MKMQPKSASVNKKEYTEDELKYCISHAYDSKFDTEEIAPLAQAGGAYRAAP